MYINGMHIMTKGLTPTKASNQWGLHRSVLYEKMKNGELSYTKDKNNNGKERRFIDPSEMIRVFGEPEARTLNNENKTVIKTNDSEIEVYKNFVEILKKQLVEKDSLIKRQTDLLSSRDLQIQSLIDQLSDINQKLLPASEQQKELEEDYYEDNLEPIKTKRIWWKFGQKFEES